MVRVLETRGLLGLILGIGDALGDVELERCCGARVRSRRRGSWRSLRVEARGLLSRALGVDDALVDVERVAFHAREHGTRGGGTQGSHRPHHRRHDQPR